MSHSSNSINSRRCEEILEWSGPSCDCGFEAVQRTSWTIDNAGRRFYGCPRYKRNVNDGCGFLRWIDPPTNIPRFRNDVGGLFRRLDEIEGNHKELQGIIDKRDEEVGNYFK
ncbi:uncharacterized protein LOC133795630 [Humulus lupulus]|uniref:uncharacterized protein LOC133795630 n=1 Tax=Humulus lupulus TaxID=3486 RepID=UPI002B40A06E|nr:uncharacterized protein LOC133795630 [Humulus lupulus]